VSVTPKTRAILRPEDVDELRRGPDEVGALAARRVRVLRRGESAPGQEELAQRVVERVLHHPSPAAVTGNLVRVEVHGCQLRVVVEHLLEVRDRPRRIDRVAVEAAADLVVDASPLHLVEGHDRGIEEPRVTVGEVAAEQEVDGGGMRELGSPSEATVAPVGQADQLRRGGLQGGG